MKVITEKKAKLYPIPILLSNAPTNTGKMKVIEAFTIQFEKDPMAIPRDRILFGKISANSTNTTAPMEDAKKATKPTSKIKFTILPRFPPKKEYENKPRNNDIPSIPVSRSLFLPILSISNMAMIVKIRLVNPSTTVCPIAESV